MHGRQARRLGPRVAWRAKRHGLYYDITWNAMHAQVMAAAAALIDAGIAPGDRVGLLAENRIEWLLADLAILAAGAINVPPHAPLTGPQIHYQLADAQVSWLFVSSAAQLEKIRPFRSELAQLRGVVVFDPVNLAQDVILWEAFLHQGRLAMPRLRADLARREKHLGPDDLATIMYTSGTTGNPKGVMLTHGNLLSNAHSFHEAFPCRPGSIALNWLPFSHIYARTVDHYLTQVNGSVLCLAESPETLVQNLSEVRPTILSSVPRFYEKLLAAVAGLNQEESRQRLRGFFGGRIDWLGSGGAPCPLAISQAYHDAGLLMLQGYGLTESSPVISFNRPSAYKLGSVGQAIPGVEVRIDASGEVLTRGPHVMRGYWNNPAASAEALVDGWLHTGDLGRLDAEGFLYITGRKKELIILSSGKKIVPNHIEGLLLADPCIEQVMVCGEGRNYLTALLVPHWNNWRQAAADQAGAWPDDLHQLVKHPEVITWWTGRLNRLLADVAPWEQIKRFALLPLPFSVAAEELTVSLKIRRNIILTRHQEVLDKLYVE